MREIDLSRLMTDIGVGSFDVRESSRRLFEEYLSPMDRSSIDLDEISRTTYSQSIVFSTSQLDSRGTGRMILPRTKPFSSWMTTAFALHPQSGLSIAQPIRLPTNEGLFLVVNTGNRHVRVGERLRLDYGIHNYLGRDVNNVLLTIRPSMDFDLVDEKHSNAIFPVIKRQGVLQVIFEVESQFGGDSESVLLVSRETGIEHEQLTARLFDSTNSTTIVEDIHPSNDLRSVTILVSSNGFDRRLQRHPTSSESFVEIDQPLIRLYRALALRQYLNETSRLNSSLFKNTIETIVKVYQELQMYSDYDGSYS
jgi:hypothetical protein